MVVAAMLASASTRPLEAAQVLPSLGTFAATRPGTRDASGGPLLIERIQIVRVAIAELSVGRKNGMNRLRPGARIGDK